jgi:SOS-response transcriptional repressor LexA
MSEAKADTGTTIRPTKKQKELLEFIEAFIAEHGYSPSYREIMAGTRHTSVATVSLHVNNLIKRGHLRKRDRSARSLEVVKPKGIESDTQIAVKQLKATEAKWLVNKVEHFFKQAETAASLEEKEIDKLYVLIGALKVLGQDGAAQSFMPRLGELKKRQTGNEYSV